MYLENYFQVTEQKSIDTKHFDFTAHDGLRRKLFVYITYYVLLQVLIKSLLFIVGSNNFKQAFKILEIKKRIVFMPFIVE